MTNLSIKEKKTLCQYAIAMFLALVVMAVNPRSVYAAEVSAEQAKKAVRNWVACNDKPMGTRLGHTVSAAFTYKDARDSPLFYVVNLEEGGFVVTSADTDIHPIIVFSSGECLKIDPNNPLLIMLEQDMAAYKNMLAVRATTQSKQNSQAVSRRLKIASVTNTPGEQWAKLLADDQTRDKSSMSMDDADYYLSVRVQPLLVSQWDQGSVHSQTCYNYYTPKNYLCGCVATAMAQLMKYHAFPTASVASSKFECAIDDSVTTLATKGGKYSWDDMPDKPAEVSVSSAQRGAIGKLCYDAGVAVHMEYGSDGSSADTFNVAEALTTYFGYASAIPRFRSDFGNGDVDNELENTILVNLDHGFPVQMAITSIP